MPKQIKPLNDVQIANAKPGAKPKTLFDGGGLYLEVTPAGGKLWRLKYRFNGAARLLALGKYPDVSLRDARERRENARKLLTNGADPGKEKKALKAAEAARATNTFRRVAESWCAIWRHGVAEDTANRIWSNLERNVFPIIGDALIDEIKPKAIMDVLRTMEARGVTDSVRKARSAISMITRYAVQNDLTEYDPAPSTKGGIQPYKVKHMPALLSPEAVADYLRRLDAYQGRYETHAALNLLPLLFVRPGELRKMRWAELDLEKAEWKYFVTKTKTNHLVPLAKQALKILEDLRARNGGKELVFPGLIPGRPVSENTLNCALRRMDYDTKTEVTPHGFRSTARTLMAEELHIQPEYIEHQLAHKAPGALGDTYNRTKFLKERVAMMQNWADYLDKLKAGADVVPLRA